MAWHECQWPLLCRHGAGHWYGFPEPCQALHSWVAAWSGEERGQAPSRSQAGCELDPPAWLWGSAPAANLPRTPEHLTLHRPGFHLPLETAQEILDSWLTAGSSSSFCFSLDYSQSRQKNDSCHPPATLSKHPAQSRGFSAASHCTVQRSGS